MQQSGRRDFAPECNRVLNAPGRQRRGNMGESVMRCAPEIGSKILHQSATECYMHQAEKRAHERLACPESSDPHNLLADLIFDKNYATAHFEARE